MNLSIFPLKNCLFPGGVLSLMIFEIRYLKMIKKVNDEKSCFGIVLLKSGSETDKPGATEQFYDVGTRAKIIQLEVLQPTLFSIKVKGEGRFKIESANKGKYSLWNAVVSEIQDDDIVQLPKEVERLSHKLKEVLYLNKNKSQLSRAEISSINQRFEDSGWVANRWAELLPIDILQKQNLLEERDPMLRLRKIDHIIQGMNDL